MGQGKSRGPDGATEKGSKPVRLINTKKGSGARTNQQSLEHLLEAGFRLVSQGFDELWRTRGRSSGLAVEGGRRLKIRKVVA